MKKRNEKCEKFGKQICRRGDRSHNNRPVNFSAVGFNLATAALAIQDQGYSFDSLLLVHVAIK